MKRQFSLFLVAVQFLTRLPVPRLDGFQADWPSRSVRYFPLVGALIGLIGVGVWWLASLCFAPAVAVGLTLGASLLLTGALHEDGFADVCDGFGGGSSREAVLTIMKDSRIGAYGALGIALMLGLKWATLVSLPRAALPVLYIGAHMLSRWCATALLWALPYVRIDADAKARPFAGGVGAAEWLLSGALGALALLPVILLVPMQTPMAAMVGAADLPLRPALLAGTAAAVAATLLAVVYFKRRIGGYT
ncbi:MAG: adenosylcobinamide-GDP ribazoletransferase, partial [Steroidobacteraceae bacterium]